MRKTLTLDIDEGLSNYIESLQFESNRTKEIVAFMLSSDSYDVNTKTFKAWDKDNQKAYAELCVAKNKLVNEVLPKMLPKDTTIFNWHLDFYNHKVTVEVADNESKN